MEQKLLVRPSEAAELLGIGRSKVYQLLADGTLPSVRIGKSVRVPVEKLRGWVESQMKAAQAGTRT
jgi:excisionase family DNA binding protein